MTSVKKISFLTLMLTLTLSFCFLGAEELKFPCSFQTLLFGDKEGSVTPERLSSSEQQLLTDLSTNFHDSLQLLSLENKVYRIPKKLHWIWIGPKAFPEKSIENILTWKKHHPSWEMNFWTDSEERPIPVDGMVRHLISTYDFSPLTEFLPRTDNWGEKADIIRYVLLNNEGGIYIDHDAKCEKPFDILAMNFDFVAALEKPGFHETLETKILPSNAIICSVPQHPILKKTLETIASVWDSVENQFPEQDPISNKERVLHRTFLSFALSALELQKEENFRTLLLPTAYFFSDQIFRKDSLKKLKEQRIPFANHSYESSWTQK